MVELSAQNVVMDSFLDTQSRANSLKWFTLVYAYLAKYGQRVSVDVFSFSALVYSSSSISIFIQYATPQEKNFLFWTTLNIIQHYDEKQVVPRPPMCDHGGGPTYGHDGRRMVVAMTYSMSRWVTCLSR